MTVMICLIEPGLWRVCKAYHYQAQNLWTSGETIEEFESLFEAKEFVNDIKLEYVGCE